MSELAVPVLARLRELLPLENLSWSQLPDDGGDWPQAAVLVALSEQHEPTVLLGRRGMHLSTHPGEVAFPGGKREPEDQSPWDTALREAYEEVGIQPQAVTRLGELPPLITRTGFQVFPFVGSIPSDFDPTVDPAEFDSVFAPVLPVFADRSIYRLETMSDGVRSRRVPHYQVGEDNVWGVTAAILALLANVAYDAGLDLQRDWETAP
ncbi:MAG: 8-oxo-dGTP pyrophosphatase MutT (NUDIX family) [Bacteroidia bacterium]|jgi:8-oxo-dGTP pyrophosphatase MutT (NUDIX family)